MADPIAMKQIQPAVLFTHHVSSMYFYGGSQWGSPDEVEEKLNITKLIQLARLMFC